MDQALRLPSWLNKRVGPLGALHRMRSNLRGLDLHTVCEEARCPNIGECWSRGTATLMILGKTCTRHCGFCSVKSGKTGATDPGEPEKAAVMVEKMNLRHVVITMVARDDLEDGGASHVAAVIGAIRDRTPHVIVEVLTSDFQGSPDAIEAVVSAGPDVFNHNIETVRRLTPTVRHKASYERSLDLLRRIKSLAPRMTTKSGLMLGFGEGKGEVLETLGDLRGAGCELLTIGQYLRPTPRNLPVVEYIRPEVFEEWREVAESIGFKGVASGPYVRSSYQAEELSAISSQLRVDC